MKRSFICKVDGRSIKTNSDVIGYIGQRRPGDKINVKVNRYGNEKTFDVVLKNRGGSLAPEIVEEDLFTMLGASFEEVDEKTLKRLDLQNGVRVSEIERGLIARKTSMREGFIITHVGGERVSSVEELKDVLEDQDGGVLIEGRYEEYSKKEYYALGLN